MVLNDLSIPAKPLISIVLPIINVPLSNLIFKDSVFGEFFFYEKGKNLSIYLENLGKRSYPTE